MATLWREIADGPGAPASAVHKLRAVLCSSLLLKHIPLQRSEGCEHRAVAQRG